MIWMPHVTVAAVIKRADRFLMVTEESDEGVVFNQPAGHWEENETLVDAVIRETLEETAYQFAPDGLVGCYQWKIPNKDKTYLRFCFYGRVTGYNKNQSLDDGIISANWHSLDEIEQQSCHKRSPMVLACINDYLNGKRYSLDMLNYIAG